MLQCKIFEFTVPDCALSANKVPSPASRPEADCSCAARKIESTDPVFRKHNILVDYDATLNDPDATRTEKTDARKRKKRQAKRQRNLELGLTAEGKLRKKKFRKLVKTNNGADIFYQRTNFLANEHDGYEYEEKVTIVKAINEIHDDVGTINTLKTEDTTTVVAAMNEIHDDLGTVSTLTTTETSNMVSAVNELDADIGDRTALITDISTNIVSAILNPVMGDAFEFLYVNISSNAVTLAGGTEVTMMNAATASYSIGAGQGRAFKFVVKNINFVL